LRRSETKKGKRRKTSILFLDCHTQGDNSKCIKLQRYLKLKSKISGKKALLSDDKISIEEEGACVSGCKRTDQRETI
jgi:hypothetical protein